MHLKFGARVLLTLGFLAASISYSSWIVNRTALDPSATRSATHALISEPSVRSALAKQLHDALAPALGRSGADPKLGIAVNAAVADPRFVAAFADAITELHAAILSDHASKVTLDTQAVTASLRTAVAHHDPALAAKVQKLGTVKMPLGSGAKLPHVGGLAHTVGRVGAIAALSAMLLLGSALLLVHDAKMIRRVGRRTAFLAFGPVIAFAVLPRVLAAGHGNSEAVGAAILRTYGHRVLFSAAVLVVIGVSTWLIAAAVPALRRVYRPTNTEQPAPATTPLPAAAVPVAAPRAVPEKLYL